MSKQYYVYRAPKLGFFTRLNIYLQLQLYWNLKAKLRRAKTVLIMLLTKETRLYYLYTTRTLVIVTWKNYNQIVKMDMGEAAMLLERSPDGDAWVKAERF